MEIMSLDPLSIDLRQSTSWIHGLDDTSDGGGVCFRRTERSHHDIVQDVLRRRKKRSFPLDAKPHQYLETHAYACLDISGT